MKVADVQTFVVTPDADGYWHPKNWLFVRVMTDEGLVGWGECYTGADRDLAIQAHVDQLGRYLIGRNPFSIKHFTHVAYADFASMRGSMDFFSALSGLELALWDIVGKYLGQPVYNLLGGPFREHVRVYANGWIYKEAWERHATDESARRAQALVAEGFTALKFDPFTGPLRAHISRAEEDAAVECVAAIRDAVGPEVDLLIDVHRRLAPVVATRVARRIEEFAPFWYEEPVSSRSVAALAEVRRDISLPVVTGEELYRKEEFLTVFENHAADIINPDVASCGGLLELMEIAAIAEANLVSVAPHNYNSTTVALAATLQACAVIPNFLITEYFVNFAPVGNEISVAPLVVKDGAIDIPSSPGLGVELDQDALDRFPYQASKTRQLRLPADESPRSGLPRGGASPPRSDGSRDLGHTTGPSAI